MCRYKTDMYTQGTGPGAFTKSEFSYCCLLFLCFTFGQLGLKDLEFRCRGFEA